MQYLTRYIKYIFSIILLLTFLQEINAQKQDNRINESEIFPLTTPQRTVSAHLIFLQSENYNPKKAAKALYPFGYGQKQREKLAIKLLQILDGKNLVVDTSLVPNTVEHYDSVSKTQRYYLFPSELPDVYLERKYIPVQKGYRWLYSRHTLKNIEKIHKEIYPFGLDKLLEMLPERANNKFLGLALWQYIGILIVIGLAFVLHWLFTFIFNTVIRKILARVFQRKQKWEKEFRKLIKAMARPASFFMLFWILSIILPVLQLPVWIAGNILLFIEIAQPVFIAVIATRLVDFVGSHLAKMAEKTKGTMDDQLIPLVRKTVKFLIVLVVSLVILQKLDFNVTTLLTGISIGGIAFALAAQDTIKNFFGSVTIFLDRPFQVGDWVVGSGVDGTVEEVGFRSTRVRTFHNSLVYIPNGKLADMTIDNMGLRAFRRFKTTISITYDTPPRLIDAYVTGLRKIVNMHPDTRKDSFHIYLNEFSASSLDILFYIFFEVPDWADELRARHEVMLATIKLAERLGVRFAFPTQTIHIEDMPGQESLTPQHQIMEGGKWKEETENFLDAYFKAERFQNRKYGGGKGFNFGEAGE